MSLCLAAGALAATLATQSFTLAWTHSIEQIRWEEDWRIAGATLVLDAARVRGSGAGMEIPDGARLHDGIWHYQPQQAPLPRLTLAHSPYTAGYQLCTGGTCRPLADLLPALPASAVIELQPCVPARSP